MIDFCKSTTNSFGFRRFILALIVTAGALVGLETYPQFSEGTSYGGMLHFAQSVILLVFVIEIVMKIIACGSQPWKYFSDLWNVLDFFIVAVCLLPMDMHSATVVRMARILRALRMVTVLPRLRLLVTALLKSIPSLGYIGILLGLHFYIYSVIGTITFGKNDPIRFGSLHVTATTLFQVLTLEGWNDVRDTQVLGSDVTYDDSWKVLSADSRVSQAQPALATAYFVSFILLGTMIMLNLFTGVIISSMEEAQDEVKETTMEQELAQRGFLTLHDQIGMMNTQLQRISTELAKLQSQKDA